MYSTIFEDLERRGFIIGDDVSIEAILSWTFTI